MSSPREVPQVWAGPREAVVGRWWGLFSRFGCWIRKIHSFSGLVDTFEFRGQEVGTLSLPVAFAFDLDLVGVVGQTVKSALGKNRVIEQRNGCRSYIYNGVNNLQAHYRWYVTDCF